MKITKPFCKSDPRRQTLLLLAVLLAASVTACASNDSTDPIPTTAQTAATEHVETIDPFYTTNLAVRDFAGAEFVIASSDNPNIHGSTVPDAETGEMLNDALYKRNQNIEETYHVDLTEFVYDHTNAGILRTSVLAGEDAYDLIMLTCPDALTWWKEELLTPIDQLPNINFEKGYWDQNLNNSLSIGGVRYIAEGAFNLDIYDLTFCLLFNKSVANQFNIGNLYQTVSDGAWTFDTMRTAMLAVAGDVNGDGKMDDADRWGYTSHPKMVAPGFWIGGGVTSISKDENDLPYNSMTESTFLSVWDSIFNVIHDTGAAYLTEGDQTDIPTECRLIFEEDRALFIDMSFFYIDTMRGMDTDFGIIPYPKYEESQQDYHARVCYYFPVVVPVTNADTDMTGYMLEVLNYHSYHDVIPAYYDVALKTKGARDEESAAMLDLIFQARVIDIGDSTLCDVIRDNFIYQQMKNNKRDLASTVARQEKTIAKRLNVLTQ